MVESCRFLLEPKHRCVSSPAQAPGARAAGGITGGRRPAGRCCLACAKPAQRRRRQIRESFGSRSQHYMACRYALELGPHGAWRLEEKSL
jgi:hypothetical protein